MELIWATLPLFFAIAALLVYMHHQHQLHLAERKDLLDRIMRLTGAEKEEPVMVMPEEMYGQLKESSSGSEEGKVME
ncbi:hypothetical protein [Paenibacillus turpanensis]|uniref:hypothetical protein n=1 Tax=Paenibacillus turpanensis TaxID=2689078 RepID=UPI00140751DF|nr:hypothetical protein [Paenibacillus turpanensis]